MGMDREMEFKAFPAEFKADEKVEGKFEGYFSVFGNIDDGGDVMHCGAFSKTIQERGSRIKVFYGHDWSKLIAPPPALKEDKHGLFAAGRLTLGSFWGKEVWELMKDGALTEGSIGYQAIKTRWDDATGARHLLEVALYEISPVPLGMNALTDISAVKSAMRILKSADGAIEAGEIFDAISAKTAEYQRSIRLVENELKEGRMLSASSKEKVENAVSAMKSALTALDELLAAAEPAKNDDHSALDARIRSMETALKLIGAK